MPVNYNFNQTFYATFTWVRCGFIWTQFAGPDQEAGDPAKLDEFTTY